MIGVVSAMNTTESLHKEISEIIRIMSEYKCLKYNQVMRLFPNKTDTVIKSIISRMIKQKRIVYSDENDMLSYGEENKKSYNHGLISAFWVLIDLLDEVEYHSPSEYPVQIAFFTNHDLYEIVYVEPERETLINHVLSPKSDNTPPSRIIVVEEENQIPQIKIANILCYCIVGESGGITYYDNTE